MHLAHIQLVQDMASLPLLCEDLAQAGMDVVAAAARFFCRSRNKCVQPIMVLEKAAHALT